MIAITLSSKVFHLGQVLIRGVDDSVILSLKERAVKHGRSLEAELRQVLTEAARPSRAQLIKELAEIRAMTPPGPRILAEDIVRESRDER
jgi:plasmid stability protein